MFVDFYYHASERSEKIAHSFFGKFSDLVEIVGGNVISANIGVRGYDIVIAAYDIGAGFFPLFYELFVIIPAYPVIAVDKADPLARSNFKTFVFGAALLFVFAVGYDFEKLGEIFFVFV